MKKIVYLFGEVSKETLAQIRRLQPDLTFQDKSAQSRIRPQFKNALKSLENGDELIITKFSNTLRQTYQLSLLLDFCSLINVRLISIEDKIDTGEKLYGHTSALRMMQIIKELPHDIYSQRTKVGEEPVTKLQPNQTSKREARMENERRVVSLYLAGYSIETIMKMCNIKHSTLYNILTRYGIKRDRVYKDKIIAG